ncbi:FAD-binding protein [Cetobacterium sp. 8H]|uniref:FAD-binding protein n=1 Tax=Cetobacterium sp. 8H TaxID=2759681 RepID=UPI00163C4E84|nr:FAD-binding protein [Cetobacterium sp. 8H]MBC2850038.1 FAD-binding protein [Cetobacterium sp. 8H]
MKSRKIKLSIAIISLIMLACGSQEKSIIGKGNGFSGEIKVNVVTENNKIKNLELVEDNETSHIISRAFPILKERILEAQSPIVDSVSGATYTSLGIKRAVASALKEGGKDFGRITIRTKGVEKPVAHLEPVNTDLVIVGGGPAGLAAAISAKEAGLEKIILIEKLDILSGNGKYDMNFYDLINSEAEKKAGVEDSVEKLIADNTNPMDTAERTRAQAEGASTLDSWLRSMGIKLNHYYGKRGHMAEKDAYAGEEVQDGMEAKVKSLGIDVRTGTKGTDFIVQDGKIIGVKVQNGNDFYDINAKAIIVATGGFSANKELLAKYSPGTENFQTSNQLGATGDFIPVFEKNNIKLENLEELNLFPFIIRSTRDLTGGGDGFMLVNSNAKRFMSENISKNKRFEAANTILAQPEGKAFYVYDQNLYNSSYRLQKHVAKGYHIKADTLEELATKLQISSNNLIETRDNFNRAIRGEVKDEFRDKPFKREFKMEGPYYGVQVESAVHMTRGGVSANEKTEVVDVEGDIVPGLYAAGEVTNSSAAYSASVIFGRIAGENAVKYINNK